ncbi:hypothetical protein AB5N19_09650 [Seiridium cardinale]
MYVFRSTVCSKCTDKVKEMGLVIHAGWFPIGILATTSRLSYGRVSSMFGRMPKIFGSSFHVIEFLARIKLRIPSEYKLWMHIREPDESKMSNKNSNDDDFAINALGQSLESDTGSNKPIDSNTSLGNADVVSIPSSGRTGARGRIAYTIQGSNIGLVAREHEWPQEELQKIADQCSYKVGTRPLNETRKSVPDKEHKYVTIGEKGTIITKPWAWLPRIAADQYVLGLGKPKADTKTGKPKLYSDIVMVGKDPYFLLNQWTIEGVILEGVDRKVLDAPPRMNNGRPERRIGYDFARIGMPKLATGALLNTMIDSMPRVLGSVTEVMGLHWANASWGVTNVSGNFVYKAANGTKQATQRLQEAMNFLNGRSAYGVATIAISVAVEGKILHNFFTLKTVDYHSPPQSSSTGMELDADMFEITESLGMPAGVGPLLNMTSSAFVPGNLNPFANLAPPAPNVMMGTQSDNSQLFTNTITYPIFNMNSRMVQKVRSIPKPVRATMDTSKSHTIIETIRTRMLDATMDLLRGLYPISDTVTYSNVARYYLAAANSAPVRCVCVGISPHENGILPAVASALAYSPEACIGITTSIQVLSQAMSTHTVRMKNNSAYHSQIETRGEFTSKFAFMLRTSYACSEIGMLFVNASPVITHSTSKECRSMSLFSEWLGKLLTIHSEFSHRVTYIESLIPVIKTIVSL